MSDAERDFPHFVLGIVHGLYQAILTDVNVFLLAVSGGLLGGGPRRRGFGVALLTFVLLRRADDFMGVIHRNLQLIGGVMSTTKPKLFTPDE